MRAFFFGPTPPTPEQAEALARGGSEIMAVFQKLAQKHGFHRTALACAQLNVSSILGAMQRENVSPHIIAATQQAFQHLLTQWGALVNVPQEETLELVRGLREHMGILDADLIEATKQGGSTDGRQS